MKLNLNLAQRPYVHRRALYASYAAAAAVLLLMLVLVGGYYLRLTETQRQVEAHLAELEGRGGSSESSAARQVTPEDLRRQREEIVFANRILQGDAFRWTSLLNQLEETSVEGVSIRSLTPDYREGSLELTGLARNVDLLRDYLDELMASPYFSGVFLMNQSRTDIKDSQGGEREALLFSLVLKGAF